MQIHSAVQQMGFRRSKRGYKAAALLPSPTGGPGATAQAAKEHQDPTDPYFTYQWYLVSSLFVFVFSWENENNRPSTLVCYLHFITRDFYLSNKTHCYKLTKGEGHTSSNKFREQEQICAVIFGRYWFFCYCLEKMEKRTCVVLLFNLSISLLKIAHTHTFCFFKP